MLLTHEAFQTVRPTRMLVMQERCVPRTAATEGLLSASAPIAFGLACLVPHLSSFMAAQTGFRVDLRLEDRLTDLALEGVDVAVRCNPLRVPA